MRGKYFFYGIAALFTVMYVFAACDTGTGSDTKQNQNSGQETGNYRPIPRPKAQVVSSATQTSDINGQLASSTTSTVTLTNNTGSPVTVTTDAILTVPAGKGLEIGQNVSLKVPSTQTAEINGAVAVANGGTLDFSDLSDATDQVALTGTITVESGGTFRMKNSATPNQSSVAYDGGKLVLKQGSTAYLDSTLYIGSAIDNAPFQWPSSGSGTAIEFSSANNINIITLKGGTITVKGGTTPVMAAVIAEDATLIVDPTTAFVVVISLEVKGSLTANKPILGASASSTITFGSGVTLTGANVSNTANFYQSSGSTKEAATAGNTYTWNGSDKWVATP